MTNPLIHAAQSDTELAAVRELCWRYRAHLLTHDGAMRVLTDTFYPEHDYASLLTRIDEEHAPPDGALLLASSGTQFLGCGMYRRFDATSCEIKRVYVDDAARGMGLGRALMQALLDQARVAGYTTARLDTMKSLLGARALYNTLGFRETGPYYDVPDVARGHLCYFEYDLTLD
ncbi:GNAT family N-acetyltransferase [Puniceibacterium sp. IMCC21224]|uniref:GNAT family N-acetyltransferase n=1 Tax=Puniceibacterium sp. IMCC21224 TaxID=1618204 RepID=UPI00065D28D8|nr:GNAT family N-acetyltransferase [Puniceibacterium sp. IMCC21224]KMK67317.1 acetyltransferase (GNAT) family protein [Puniceibacterium sp. IMCC21224]